MRIGMATTVAQPIQAFGDCFCTQPVGARLAAAASGLQLRRISRGNSAKQSKPSIPGWQEMVHRAVGSDWFARDSGIGVFGGTCSGYLSPISTGSSCADRMNEGPSYMPPFEIGSKPLEGGAIGDVIESRAPEFQLGDVVILRFGWREYFTASPRELRRVRRDIRPLLSASSRSSRYDGNDRVGRAQAGGRQGRRCRIHFRSGRRGRKYGRAIGEIERLSGHWIGWLGGEDPRPSCRMRLRLAFNYKAGPILDQLHREAPDGIDVYFDNVGDESLEAGAFHFARPWADTPSNLKE